MDIAGVANFRAHTYATPNLERLFLLIFFLRGLPEWPKLQTAGFISLLSSCLSFLGAEI